MEMHEYRVPNYKVIFKQTWGRSKEFVYKALPIIIILGIVLEILVILNALEPINFNTCQNVDFTHFSMSKGTAGVMG